MYYQSTGKPNKPSGAAGSHVKLRSYGRQSTPSGSASTRAKSALKKAPARSRGQRSATAIRKGH